MACQQISVHELKQRMFAPEAVEILDVRNVDEFRAGHIEGAKLIPLPILPYRLDEIDKDKEIIVVCKSGGRSSEACQILNQSGYRHVKSLQGGLSSWTVS